MTKNETATPSPFAVAAAAFVATAKTENAMRVERAQIIANLFTANGVGTKGARSSRSVLLELEETISKVADGTVSGYKYANLARYARIVRTLDTLQLPLTADTVLPFYAVTDKLGSAAHATVEAEIAKIEDITKRAAAIAPTVDAMYSGKLKSQARAKGPGKKADDENAPKFVTVEDVLAAPMTGDAFVESVRNSIGAQASWDADTLAAVGAALVEIGNALVEANTPATVK